METPEEVYLTPSEVEERARLVECFLRIGFDVCERGEKMTRYKGIDVPLRRDRMRIMRKGDPKVFTFDILGMQIPIRSWVRRRKIFAELKLISARQWEMLVYDREEMVIMRSLAAIASTDLRVDISVRVINGEEPKEKLSIGMAAPSPAH